LRLHNLEITSYYSYLSLIYEERTIPETEKLKRKSDFLQKLNCQMILIDGGIKDPEKNSIDDYRLAVENVNNIGKVISEMGMKISWHQHWGSMFDTPETLYFLLDNTDPSIIGFCPDTAQLLISGIDPCKIFKKYKNRINYIHFKDVLPNNFLINRKDKVNNLNEIDNKNSDSFSRYIYTRDRFLDEGGYHINSKYKFTEVGRGIIDFENICSIINKNGYNGWIVVDQDYTEWPRMESLDVNLKNIKYFINR